MLLGFPVVMLVLMIPFLVIQREDFPAQDVDNWWESDGTRERTWLWHETALFLHLILVPSLFIDTLFQPSGFAPCSSCN